MRAAEVGRVEGFQGFRAGVVSRTIAAGIDVGVVLVGILVFYFTIAGAAFVIDPRAFSFPQLNLLGSSAAFAAILFVYLAVGWMTTGRSVGKLLMGLRVVGSDGRKLRPARALLRSAVCTLFPIGLYWCVADPTNRAIHDVVFNTTVLYDWSLGMVLPDASPSATPNVIPKPRKEMV